ncbi:hypothetical protein [Rhizobium leguminosarum]|uniref:hypothetical protein n=1 Tax=Rhizobium TaxID=379 RepID=UPI00103BCAA1|nr:hypothetical protein [Rhizobium leguminosarum]MBY5919748.1 hypothetical protein [Rhizobium leguminosarum]TBY26919.1 hypothetical protein E0H55_28660 [Rhizobium leguminosarum bv. viciae]TBZ58088.1 hypothetical protein E0H64_35045 [Rhizobium leguminosarum bv. viciae]
MIASLLPGANGVDRWFPNRKLMVSVCRSCKVKSVTGLEALRRKQNSLPRGRCGERLARLLRWAAFLEQAIKRLAKSSKQAA